jgi:hypothetical protein
MTPIAMPWRSLAMSIGCKGSSIRRWGIVEGDDPLAGMDGNLRKRRTLDAIKRILLRESLNQPLIVIFEDLHWIAARNRRRRIHLQTRTHSGGRLQLGLE